MEVVLRLQAGRQSHSLVVVLQVQGYTLHLSCRFLSKQFEISILKVLQYLNLTGNRATHATLANTDPASQRRLLNDTCQENSLHASGLPFRDPRPKEIPKAVSRRR